MRRLLLTSVAVVALGACAGAEPAMPQDVAFTATDFAFTGPDTIAPGVTTIRMENHGENPHHRSAARELRDPVFCAGRA
ncbi:MAG: hypothetical protein WD934_05830 [Gemmatimonadales bacterium]